MRYLGLRADLERAEKTVKALPGSQETSVTLDIGAGSNPRNPFRASKLMHLDLVDSELPGFLKVSVGEALPLATESLSFVTAFDFLEHIPRVSDNSGATSTFIGYMNEIFRVLIPGGMVLAVSPCYPSEASFADPTHVNPIARTTHKYFTGQNFARSMGYGFEGEFKKVRVVRIRPTHWLFSAGKNHTIFERIKIVASQVLYTLSHFVRFRSGKTHVVWLFQKPMS